MKLLPNWLLTPGLPVSNDLESSTFPEMVYKIYGKMNELITEYNAFVDDTNTKLANFVDKYNQDIEEFTLSMRQEFQDFIDTVDLKIADLESRFEELGMLDLEELFAEMETIKQMINDLQVDNLIEQLSAINEKVLEHESKFSDLEARITALEGKEVEVDMFYSNSTPTPSALGGVAKGTTFSNKPINEVLDMLLYPYVPFSASVSVSPNGGTFEEGESVTISSATVNITLGSADIRSIVIKNQLATTLASKTSINSGGSHVLTFNSPYVFTTDQRLVAVITDSTGALKEVGTNLFTFVSPYYYGVISEGVELTEALITGLTKDVKSKGSKSYTYTMAQQKAVISYPASYGALSKILDENSFNVTETFTRNTVTINGTSYYVYVLNSPATSTMKYTFSY